MGIKPLKKIDSDDRVLSQIQDSIKASLDPLISSLIIDGSLINGVELDSSAPNGTSINHKLGRKLNGYIVVKRNVNSIIWDSQDTNTMADKTLILKCSANVTVSLWVF